MKVRFKRTTTMSEPEKDELYDLYSKTYISERGTFLKGFDTLLYQAIAREKGRLLGFSSVDIRALPHGDEEIVSIYFGNTIVDRTYRTRGIVQRIVWGSALRAYLRYPLRRKFLFCHSSTYKPYLFYAKKLRDSFPKVGRDADAEALAVRDTLVANCPAQIGQDGWKSTKRVNWTLDDPTVAVTDADLLDPDIAFFHGLNETGKFGVYTFAPANVSQMIHQLRMKLAA